MSELDEIVRQNQLACLPFAKSGRAEADLLEKYPDLVDIIDRGKRAKIDSMALQSRLHEDELRFAGSLKARAGFPEDQTSSPSIDRSRSRPSKDRMPSTKSPSLTAKSSINDLMFDMDEGDGFFPGPSIKEARDSVGTPVRLDSQDGRGYQTETPPSLPIDNIWFDFKGKALSSVPDNAPLTPQEGMNVFGSSAGPARNLIEAADASSSRHKGPAGSAKPWGSAALSSTKLDMKAIMAQASVKRESNISSGLSSQAQIAEAAATSGGNKMSQRERKRQQQQQQSLQSSEPRSSPGNGPSRGDKPAFPWRTPSA